MAWAEKVSTGVVSSAPPNGHGCEHEDSRSILAIVRPGLLGIGYGTARDAAYAEDMRRLESRFLTLK